MRTGTGTRRLGLAVLAVVLVVLAEVLVVIAVVLLLEYESEFTLIIHPKRLIFVGKGKLQYLLIRNHFKKATYLAFLNQNSIF